MSREMAARSIDVNRSTIWRIERGHVHQDLPKIAKLLTLYGVTDPHQRETVLGLATEARAPGWWDRDDLPLWARTLYRLEAEATQLHEYAPRLIPELLQTADYARLSALREHPSASRQELDRRVEARTQRQELLARPGGPRLWVIADEAALLRSIGDRDVLTDQLDHLVTAIKQPNVTLQILRLHHSGYLPRSGPFTLICGARGDDVVYADHLTERTVLRAQADVDTHRLAHTRLSASAGMPADTPGILTELRASLR